MVAPSQASVSNDDTVHRPRKTLKPQPSRCVGWKRRTRLRVELAIHIEHGQRPALEVGQVALVGGSRRQIRPDRVGLFARRSNDEPAPKLRSTKKKSAENAAFRSPVARAGVELDFVEGHAESEGRLALGALVDVPSVRVQVESLHLNADAQRRDGPQQRRALRHGVE